MLSFAVSAGPNQLSPILLNDLMNRMLQPLVCPYLRRTIGQATSAIFDVWRLSRDEAHNIKLPIQYLVGFIMSQERSFTTSVPDVVSEIFDGEAVIANYESGLYYSISPSGSLIWQALGCGLNHSQIVQWLSAQFTDQATEFDVTVATFIDSLEAEGLILEAPTDTRKGALPILEGTKFDRPVLERFDELQELLLIDPVHDVDTTGWPRRPE